MTAVAQQVEIPRDRWGKPLIIPPNGGKSVPYFRASSFGDVLEDRSNLEKWRVRKVIEGLVARKDLWLRARTAGTDKWALNTLAREAIDAAGGGERASIGTILHSLTERLDRGEPWETVAAEAGDDYLADLAAYVAVTERFNHVCIEQFMVCDELGVAGTPDRLSVDLDREDDARLVVGDLKSGGSSGGSSGFLDKHAVQLAIYAHSAIYDPATGERTPIALDRAVGWIYHMPAGEGTCDLYQLDLEAGWEGALLAADVRAWRKRRGICTPVAR